MSVSINLDNRNTVFTHLRKEVGIFKEPYRQTRTKACDTYNRTPDFYKAQPGIQSLQWDTFGMIFLFLMSLGLE